MNQEYQDRIDKYLLGQISEQDSQAFENEIANNRNLKEQFEFTKNVKEAIDGRNRRLAQIKEWKEAYEAKKTLEKEEYRPTGSGYDYSIKPQTEIELKPQSSKRRYLYWISGIAAIFVVGFFMFSPIVFEKSGSPDYPIYVNISSLRSTKDNADVAKIINDGNYNLALEQIEEKVKKEESENLQTENDKSKMDGEEYAYLKEVHEIQMDELNLLRAYALYGLKRTEEAMGILNGIRQRESKFKAQADSLYNLYK